MSADKQLKAYIDRVLRLKEEQDTLGDDIREVYAEAKSEGYDKTVMGKLVAHLRKVQKAGEGAVSEQEMVFDTYLQAYHRASGTVVATHTHEEDYDRDTGEILGGEPNAKLIATVATGMQTEIGRKALVTALDIMIEREEANEFQAKASDDNGATEQDTEYTADSVTGDASRSSRGDDSPALHSEKATVATQGEATEPTSDERDEPGILSEGRRAAANAGGDNVERSGLPAGLADPTSNTGEGAANTALPADGIFMGYVPQSGVKRLPFASCFPEHSKAEYERLEKDIAASRVHTPIIRQGDVIVDGFARYTIARKYGFAYPVQEYTGNDVLLDVIEWQRAARNFTPAQEKKIAADLAKELPHRADDIMAAFGLAEALEAAE